jgi:hypothetical protein
MSIYVHPGMEQVEQFVAFMTSYMRYTPLLVKNLNLVLLQVNLKVQILLSLNIAYKSIVVTLMLLTITKLPKKAGTYKIRKDKMKSRAYVR